MQNILKLKHIFRLHATQRWDIYQYINLHTTTSFTCKPPSSLAAALDQQSLRKMGFAAYPEGSTNQE